MLTSLVFRNEKRKTQEKKHSFSVNKTQLISNNKTIKILFNSAYPHGFTISPLLCCNNN